LQSSRGSQAAINFVKFWVRRRLFMPQFERVTSEIVSKTVVESKHIADMLNGHG